MNLPITITDVLFAAFLATIIALIIRVAGKMFRSLFTGSTILSHGSKVLTSEQLDAVIKRCRRLFPIESLVWDGTTFKSGSTLRMVNDKDEIFEGEFLGINNDNMVCLITAECIVAQQINAIAEIHVL